jgi:Ca-activated chloride channel family protein
MTFNPIVPAIILFIVAFAIVGFMIFCIVNKRFRHMNIFRRIGIALLIVLAFARPTITGGKADVDTSNLNVFFVIDNTGSMATKDMRGGTRYRYEIVADDIARIVKLFPGAKYGVFSLDYNNRQTVPLINNVDAINSYAETLKPKPSIHSSDSDISTLLNLASERIASYNSRYPNRNSIVFFMSDGEDNVKNKSKAPKELGRAVVGGAVIGYGTTEGAYISRIENDGTIVDTEYTEHISKIDEANLTDLASNIGIKYFNRESSEEIFNDTNNFINSTSTLYRSDKTIDTVEDLYWLPMLGAIALMLWDLFAVLESLLLERKAVE